MHTNDMDHDEVFVPYTRSEFGDFPTPMAVWTRMFNIVKMLLFGWPAYVTFPVFFFAKNN
jgi:hypothetical protein